MKSAVICFLAAGLSASAQNPNPLMSGQESNELFARAMQLMESTTVAMPELNRAGAPLIENVRQGLANLRLRPNNTEFTYTFLTNLRAYLVLADAVPRPYPFPVEASKQLAELRDVANRTDVHFRAALAQREAQVRSGDRDNLARYAEANQKLSPPATGKRRIVFLGDSITDFWRLNEYFPENDFVNRGISGQITSEMLGRFKADVINLKPEAVLILAGTNDLARGVNINAIENNLSMMADLADRHGIKVIFASVLPVSDYHKDQNPAWERTTDRPARLIVALNAWMKAVAAEHGYVYCDYYSLMIDRAGQMVSDLADDGLHPNGKGYRIMAPIAVAAISRTAGAPVQQKQKRLRLFGKD